MRLYPIHRHTQKIRANPLSRRDPRKSACHSSTSHFTHPASRFFLPLHASRFTIFPPRRHTGLIVLKAADREPDGAIVVEPVHSVVVVVQVPAPGVQSTIL